MWTERCGFGLVKVGLLAQEGPSSWSTTTEQRFPVITLNRQDTYRAPHFAYGYRKNNYNDYLGPALIAHLYRVQGQLVNRRAAHLPEPSP